MTSADTTAQTFWTPGCVQTLTGGNWLRRPADPQAPLAGLGIDSRSTGPRQVFLAVKGDRFDGHDFVTPAIEAGAAMAIVENDIDLSNTQDAGVLLVNNAVEALHKLARGYRDVLRLAGCTVIAVAGSNGKTTTRHLIHAVLSARFKGTQSPKSFNNHLGVPLTLLGAATDDRFIVAEVGTNHPGEIAALGELLQPDAAVVTCIGQEHMEFFGDLRAVAEEEACILRSVSPPERGGKVFIETDAYRWIRDTAAFNPDVELIVYGLGAEGACEQRENLGERQRFSIGGSVHIDLPLIAPHDLNNALGAVAVGRSMGVTDEQIKAALESISPMPGRLQVKRFGAVKVIDDTYNANPDSTLAALAVLSDYPTAPGGRRIAVLGDMLELGASAEESHRELGRSLARLCREGIIQQVALIGPLMAVTAEELAQQPPKDGLSHFTQIDPETPARITGLIRPNDTVLYKGSRGTQMERLIPALKDRFADDPED
jgi:UDP-N-acetylmuramoyl-tripeptide--D-alanyl-D-alanine ligase